MPLSNQPSKDDKNNTLFLLLFMEEFLPLINTVVAEAEAFLASQDKIVVPDGEFHEPSNVLAFPSANVITNGMSEALSSDPQEDQKMDTSSEAFATDLTTACAMDGSIESQLDVDPFSSAVTTDDPPKEMGMDIFSAVAKGNHESFLDWVAQGADVHAVDERGLNLLHVAARYNHHLIVIHLIAFGVDTHAMTPYGLTPLHMALQKQNLKVSQILYNFYNQKIMLNDIRFASFLLQKLPSYSFDEFLLEELHLNEPLFEDKTLLYFSLLSRNADITVHLLNHHAKPTAACFKTQLLNDQPEELVSRLHLLGAGDLVDQEIRVIHFERPTSTLAKTPRIPYEQAYPLHFACQEGRFVDAKFLIENGADIYQRDNRGQLPIEWAWSKDRADDMQLIDLFISSGFDIQSPLDKKGNDFLTKVVRRHVYGLPLLKHLISKIPDFHQSPKNSRLIYALAESHTVELFYEKAKVLIEAGVDPNAVTMHGITPMYKLTCTHPNIKKVRRLLKLGANFDCHYKQADWSILHHLSVFSLEPKDDSGLAILNLALKHLEVDLLDAKGHTPLSVSINSYCERKDPGKIYSVEFQHDFHLLGHSNMEIDYSNLRSQITWGWFPDTDAIIALLEAGANVHQEDDAGVTPWMVAKKSKNNLARIVFYSEELRNQLHKKNNESIRLQDLWDYLKGSLSEELRAHHPDFQQQTTTSSDWKSLANDILIEEKNAYELSADYLDIFDHCLDASVVRLLKQAIGSAHHKAELNPYRPAEKYFSIKVPRIPMQMKRGSGVQKKLIYEMTPFLEINATQTTFKTHPIETANLSARHLTSKGKPSKNEKTTFIFFARGVQGMLPEINKKNDRTILLVTEEDYQSWPKDTGIIEHHDVVILDRVNAFVYQAELGEEKIVFAQVNAEDIGKITTRRLAALYIAHHYELEDALFMDDNLATIASASTAKDHVNWSGLYDELKKAAQHSNKTCLSLNAFSIRKKREGLFAGFSDELEMRTNAGGKLFYLSLSKIRQKFQIEGSLAFLFPAVNLVLEDLFMQYMLENYGENIASISPEDLYYTRSSSGEGLCVKTNLYTAETWLAWSAEIFPLEQRAVVKKIQAIIESSIASFHKRLEKIKEADLSAYHQRLNKPHPENRIGYIYPQAENTADLIAYLSQSIDDEKTIHHPHQIAAIESLRSIGNKRAVDFDMATGTGKTLVFLTIASFFSLHMKNKNTFIVCPQVQLVNQTYSVFMKYILRGVLPSILLSKIIQMSSGETHIPYSLVKLNKKIADGGYIILCCKESWMLLSKRETSPSINGDPDDELLTAKKIIKNTGLVVIDESHLLSKSDHEHIKSLLTQYTELLFLSFSATPVKLLGEKIYRYGIEKGVQDNRLSPYYFEKFEPSPKKNLDVLLAFFKTRLHPTSGEPLYRRQFIVYLPTIKIAESFARKLNKENIPSFAMHSGLSHVKREEILGYFKDRTHAARGLILVNMGTFGLDFPHIDTALVAKGVNPVTAVQILGRLLRVDAHNPSKISYCVFSDEVNLSNIPSLDLSASFSPLFIQQNTHGFSLPFGRQVFRLSPMQRAIPSLPVPENVRYIHGSGSYFPGHFLPHRRDRRDDEVVIERPSKIARLIGPDVIQVEHSDVVHAEEHHPTLQSFLESYLPSSMTPTGAFENKLKNNLFSAIAQAMNQHEKSAHHDEKSLRLLCLDYAKSHKGRWVKQWVEDHHMPWEGYLACLQYTVEELEAGHWDPSIPIPTTPPNIEGIACIQGRPYIAGRAHIEGRMICEELSIRLELVKVPKRYDFFCRNLFKRNQEVAESSTGRFASPIAPERTMGSTMRR